MTRAAHPPPTWRYGLLVVILGIGLYVVVPQLGDFRHSLSLLQHPRWVFVGVGIVLIGLTYMAAAASYCLLAFRPLSYRRTVLVQLAAMFINRLLPAGVGAAGVGYVYLRRSRHTPSQAATVAAVNNMLGIVGHAALAAVVLIVLRGSAAKTPVHFSHQTATAVWLSGALLIGVGLLAASRYHQRLKLGLADVLRQLLSYRQRPQRLGGALLTSVCLTLANITGLWACLAAVHVTLPFAVVLIVFTFGIGIGNATPTPGGLGGLEAGLLAGLVAYHVPSAIALAAVILYRLISYWLALAIGVIAFIVCQRRGYVRLT